MMDKPREIVELAARIIEARLILSVRIGEPGEAANTIAAAMEGGIAVFEVDVNSPSAFEMLAMYAKNEELLIGACSVTTAAGALAAIGQGAKFISSPVADPPIIHSTHASKVPMIAGGLTANEIFGAHHLGADVVNLFPASPAGGARYLDQVSRAFPDVKLMVSGGVEVEEVAEYFEAGAALVGIDTEYFPLSAGDYAGITRIVQDLLKGLP